MLAPRGPAMNLCSLPTCNSPAFPSPKARRYASSILTIVCMFTWYFSCRRQLWRWWRRWYYPRYLARGLLDCHQFLLWWKRSRETTTGFIRWVYSDVSAEDCGRITADWVGGRNFLQGTRSGTTCEYGVSGRHSFSHLPSSQWDTIRFPYLLCLQSVLAKYFYYLCKVN